MLVKLRGMERMRHEVMSHSGIHGPKPEQEKFQNLEPDQGRGCPWIPSLIIITIFLTINVIKIMELKQPTISEIRSYTKPRFRI